MKLKSSRHSDRPGFTLVELLVVIVIIAALAGITFTIMGRVKDSSRRATSMMNIRQIGLGLGMFTSENNNCLPLARLTGSSGYWPEVIYPYISKPDLFVRPGTVNAPMSASEPNGYFDLPDSYAKTTEGKPLHWNYTVNGGGPTLPFSEDPSNNSDYVKGLARRISTIESPERTVFIAEGTSWWLNSEAKRGSNRLYRWKNGTTNILFGDGSMRNLNPDIQLSNNDFLCKRKP